MDKLGRNDLNSLLQVETGPCVSIYMPTHTAGKEGQQDPIRLKNLLNHAEQELSGEWMRSTDARQLLQPARDLLSDSFFWSQASQGLALFLSPNASRWFRLPHAFEELLVVSHRFRIRPLLRALDHEGRFWLLTLSQNKVGFYDADMWDLESVAVEGLPRNMDDALNYDDADRGSQFHSGSWGTSGKQSSVFHGQGGIPDAAKDDMRTYFRAVNQAICRHAGTSEQPLLLMCVDYLAPLYREVNTYPHLLPESAEGNPDYLDGSKLHQRVRELARRHFDQRRRQALGTLREQNGGRLASFDVTQIVPAAVQGRVATLFVDGRADVWGTYHSDQGSVDVHATAAEDDTELLDLSVVETLRNRGMVYPLENEQADSLQGPVAALFRY